MITLFKGDKKKISCTIVGLIIVSIGWEKEFNNLASLELSITNYFYFIKVIGLLLFSLIPFFIMDQILVKRWKLQIWLPIVAVIISVFTTGWLAGYGNELVEKWLMDGFGTLSFINDWKDALVAPFIEEGLKLVCAILIFGLLSNKKNIQSVLVIGIAVGIGFQISEDVSTIIFATETSIEGLVQQSWTIIAGALSSHWLYTGILSTGFVSLFIKPKGINRKYALIYTIMPVMLHVLWNSPVNDVSIVPIIINTLSLFLLLNLIQSLDKAYLNK